MSAVEAIRRIAFAQMSERLAGVTLGDLAQRPGG